MVLKGVGFALVSYISKCAFSHICVSDLMDDLVFMGLEFQLH